MVGVEEAFHLPVQTTSVIELTGAVLFLGVRSDRVRGGRQKYKRKIDSADLGPYGPSPLPASLDIKPTIVSRELFFSEVPGQRPARLPTPV